MGWLGTAETVAIVIVLLVAVPLLWLFLRRRWLSQEGAVDCALRLSGPQGRWVLGVARYRAETFEWYRAFSPSLRPDRTLRQGEWTVTQQRTPDAVEAVALYEQQRVVDLAHRSGARVELALEPGALTGFLSWMEAAAPGTARYGNTV